MLNIKFTNQFKKDYKKILLRGYDTKELEKVIEILHKEEKLPEIYKDHKLNDSNKYQVEVYENTISEFESYYPNIKVNMRTYTDYQKIYNDVITNISTKTTPNVCISYPDHVATYATGDNIVVKLDDLIDNEKYGLGGSEVKFDAPTKDEIIPKFLQECKINDSYYLMPYMRSTEALYINKTLLNQLGYEIPNEITWDFIYEVSDEAVKQNEDGTYVLNGQNVMIPFIYKSTDNMMIQLLKQSNAEYTNKNGDVLLFNDKTKEILTKIGEEARKGAFSTFKISSYPANFLNAGQCIFAIDSTAGATWMGCNAPNIDIPEEQLIDFETVVTTIPQINPENPQMISQGPSICIFNKDDNLLGDIRKSITNGTNTGFIKCRKRSIHYKRIRFGYKHLVFRILTFTCHFDYTGNKSKDNGNALCGRSFNISGISLKFIYDNLNVIFLINA